MKPDKKACIRAISDRIEAFYRAGLNEEYEAYAKGLLARIAYLPQMNLQRGRPEIWAAAIVTIIARLNFLFDKSGPDATTLDAICAFFGTVRSTTGNKATAIEKGCGIRMGEPGLCREEVTETLDETGDGPIFPKNTLSGGDGGKRSGKRFAISRTLLERRDGQEEPKNKKLKSDLNKSTKPQKKDADSDRQMRLFDDF